MAQAAADVIKPALAGFERLIVRLAARARVLAESRPPDRIDWRNARHLWPRFTGDQ